MKSDEILVVLKFIKILYRLHFMCIFVVDGWHFHSINKGIVLLTNVFQSVF